MGPNDKEIEIQKNRFPVSSAVDKGNGHIFEEGFEKGAKWARDFDPWYYIEDSGFPTECKEVLICLHSGQKIIANLETNDLDGNDDYVWREKGEGRPISLENAKCWMYIPEPKR
jgi:hypothetical protein